jgi:flavin reductase (DIM6/NTAB) family NADH-FMN oxidoreductase RutF
MVAKKSLPLSLVYKLLEPGPVTLVTTALKDQSNVMTMTWHMMIDFEPPIFACIISDENFSFDFLMKTGECVINIPSEKLAKKVVQVGNSSGKNIDKFKKFDLKKERASCVDPPLLTECYASLECTVIDTSMAKKYNLFILQVVKAWIRPQKTRVRMLHHCGCGVFVVDGKIIKLFSKKK